MCVVSLRRLREGNAFPQLERFLILCFLRDIFIKESPELVNQVDSIVFTDGGAVRMVERAGCP